MPIPRRASVDWPCGRSAAWRWWAPPSKSAWARCYADESKTLVYDWVKQLGLKYMPAVNFVERGETVKGNSVPRYHILWGTGRELVETLIERLRKHPRREQLTLLHLHLLEQSFETLQRT